MDPVLEQISPDGEDVAEPLTGAIDGALAMLSAVTNAVLARAEAIAVTEGSSAICSEHLLAALADPAAPGSSQLLARAGISAESLAATHRFVAGARKESASAPSPLPRSPRVDEILLRAEKDARKRGSAEIGSLHLLHAMLATRQGLAVFLLESPGAGTTALNAAVTAALSAGATDEK